MSDHELNQLCYRFPISLVKYTIDDENYFNAAKIKTLKSLLPKLINQGDKILLFSQFVIALDILERFLNLMQISFLRMDGSTNVLERQDLVDKFNTFKNIKVFLLSTRACGLGLNLTSANVVIMHDIDFNPHNDVQAEDRVHRVGQLREITVYKLIVKDTIEEKMLKTGVTKLKLDSEIKRQN